MVPRLFLQSQLAVKPCGGGRWLATDGVGARGRWATATPRLLRQWSLLYGTGRHAHRAGAWRIGSGNTENRAVSVGGCSWMERVCCVAHSCTPMLVSVRHGSSGTTFLRVSRMFHSGTNRLPCTLTSSQLGGRRRPTIVYRVSVMPAVLAWNDFTNFPILDIPWVIVFRFRCTWNWATRGNGGGRLGPILRCRENGRWGQRDEVITAIIWGSWNTLPCTWFLHTRWFEGKPRRPPLVFFLHIPGGAVLLVVYHVATGARSAMAAATTSAVVEGHGGTLQLLFLA